MSVLKNISFYLAAAVFAKGLGFIQSFLIAKALGPTSFGVWMTLLLIASYSPIVCLGTVEAMLKEVPFYLGRNDLNQVRSVENGVFGSIVLAAGLFVLIGVVGMWLFPPNFLGAGPVLLMLVLVTIAVGNFTGYFYWRLAAYENFAAVASLDVCRSFLAFILIGGLGWAWHLQGAVFGYLLHESAVCALAIWQNSRAHGRVGITFRRKVLLHAVQVGLPITILWWILILQASVDRVVLGSLVGILAVGYYGLGISITSVLALLPGVVGRVLYPKVNRQFGTDSNSDTMKSLVLTPSLALGAIVVNTQLGLLVIMPLVYNHLLAKYQSGLVAGQILLVGSFSVSLLRNGANYLVATHKERLLLQQLLFTLAFNVIADVALIKAGFGLEGVAVGTSLAGFLLNSLVWRRVLGELGYVRAQIWKKLLGLYTPVLALVTGIVVLRCIHRHFLGQFDALSIALAFILFLSMNSFIFLSPAYRAEVPQWKCQMQRILQSLKWRLRAANVFVSASVEP
jgi:O-antigen/teichoic acid export membrane protein